jgi:hypothetical protein
MDWIVLRFLLLNKTRIITAAASRVLRLAFYVTVSSRAMTAIPWGQKYSV